MPASSRMFWKGRWVQQARSSLSLHLVSLMAAEMTQASTCFSSEGSVSILTPQPFLLSGGKLEAPPSVDAPCSTRPLVKVTSILSHPARYAGPKAPIRLEGTAMTHVRFSEDGGAQARPQSAPSHQNTPVGSGHPPGSTPQPPSAPGQLPAAPPTTNKSAAQRLRERLLGVRPTLGV